MESEEASGLAAGVRLGAEWELQEPLGRGPTGEVWRARHLVFEDRVCAAKVPLDAEAREVLRRAGVVQHGLEHPNLVKTLGLSLAHDPPYFLCELLPSGSLATVFARGPLAPRRAWELLWPILDALEHAHAHGVVHGALKPSNVLLGRGGVPRVGDFSLGRASRERDALLLARGVPLPYLSPEQRQGREPDARSDLHAFGALLHEALAGEPPGAAFEPLSERRPELPRVLDGVLARALAPDPRARHASAAELRRELFQGLAHAGVLEESASGPVPRVSLQSILPRPGSRETPAVPAAAGRSCPRCATPLAVSWLPGAAPQGCGRCQGVWISPAELDALAPALAKAGPGASLDPDEETADESAAAARGVACLACGRAAAPFLLHHEGQDVPVDRCREHGAWLPGPARAPLRAVLRSPGGAVLVRSLRALLGGPA